ncbi:MAG: hypothetical protein GKR89_21125 [Candidatus Latescibacteria bacterium]|nr:hypothetical protein [Candidatus Latescibacterota bacterium]
MAIDLSLTERSGIDRIDEPVTFGLPLPQGHVQSVDELTLSVAGQPVDAEIRPVDFWPDASPRWIHLDFQTSLAAGGNLSLALERARHLPIATPLTVAQEESAFTVSTGKIRVQVRAAHFNIFDQVWLAGAQGAYGDELIAPHQGGLVAWIDDAQYLSANDPNATLAVETQGPMRLVLRAEGRLQNSTGQAPLHYVCRLYFYANSPVVRLVYTVENRDATLANKVEVQGLHIDLPSAIGADGTFTFGRPGQDVQGSLAAGPAWIEAPASSRYQFGGAAAGAQAGNGKTEKSAHTGWFAIQDSVGAIGLSLRDFWQMHPSSLETDHGLLRAGLIPRRLSQTIPLYAGVARTHYLRFAFTPPASSDHLRGLVATAQAPLRPVATPAHYCRHSSALGNVLERNDSLYPPEHLEVVHRVESELDAGLEHMLTLLELRTKNGVSREAYGFLHWGDGFHYAWEQGVEDDGNIAWNGHYYGLPYMMYLEFFRSGDWRYFDYADSRAHHQMDMHLTHFAPDHPLDGGNRYCPPTEHIRVDPTDPGDYTTARPFLSNTQNHSKIQGLFHRYYLTGDERARDSALKALGFARTFGAYSDFKQPRGAAHQVMTLVQGYKFTGDRQYLDNARWTVDLWRDHFAGTDDKFIQGFFMVGLMLEAYIDYYEITGDQQVVDWLQEAADWMRHNRPGDLYSNMALGLGFLAAHTGNQDYAALQQRHLATWHGVQSNAYKDYAQHGRSLARALYYLSYQGDGIEEVDTLIPEALQTTPQTASLDQNRPNPFNPTTSIDYIVPAGPPRPVRLDIYDSRGGLVRILLDQTKPPGAYTVAWDGLDENGHPAASGAYLCRMTTGQQGQTRKMTLIK